MSGTPHDPTQPPAGSMVTTGPGNVPPTIDHGSRHRRTDPSSGLTVTGPDVRRVNDYELVERIGQGGMGEVWRGRHRWLKTEVAVKLVGHRFPAEAFVREMRTLARLDHPHIVRVFDAGRDSETGELYGVMELVRAGDLAARRPAPDPRTAARLVAQAADAVQYVHDHHVFHRDLKPGNLLLADGDRVKLSDFGLAALRGHGFSAGESSSGVVGTLPYMPPEQAEGREAAATADIYGLGAVFYELLTGHPPITFTESEDLPTRVRRVQAGAGCQPPHTVNPRVPRSLSDVCMRCLEKEPGRRYQCASDLRAALDEALRPPLWRRRAVSAARWAAPVLLGLALLLGLGWVVFGRPRELARDAVRVAAVAEKAGRRQEAVDHLTAANEQIEAILSGVIVHDRADLEFLQATARARLGRLLDELRDPVGIDHLNAARDALETLQRRHKGRDDVTDLLALVYHHLGEHEGVENRFDSAATWYDKGRVLRQGLYDARKNDPDRIRNLAASHGYLGDARLQASTPDPAAARREYAAASALREQLVALAEADPTARTDGRLAEAVLLHSRDFGNSAALAGRLGDVDAALKHVRDRAGYLEKHKSDFGASLPADFRAERARGLVDVAEWELDRAGTPDPRQDELLREAAREFEALLPTGGEEKADPGRRSELARLYLVRGKYLSRGRGSDPKVAGKAKEAFDRAARLVEGVKQAARARDTDHYTLAVAHAYLVPLDDEDQVLNQALAVRSLDRAAEAGFADGPAFRRDPVWVEFEAGLRSESRLAKKFTTLRDKIAPPPKEPPG